ncbi:MAG: sigma-54-dependent transcriptional regulator [Microbacter sp.]
MKTFHVLILDDEKRFTEELAEFLENIGLAVSEANTPASGMALLKSKPVDLLILDVRLPGIDGLDLLKEIKALYPELEVIIVSGHGDMDTVIKAMRLGAFDYLKKPFRHMDIRIAIERTKKFLTLQREMKSLEEKNSLISKSLEERIERHFIGISPAIRKVIEQALTVANYQDTNVLITGESGTGKENIARIIHYASPRKDGLFCAVNSSAVTDSLLESEFFGHKKGSFTGAVSDRKGFFEISDHGTLFLDEIADMPLNLQAKMLRAIEEKKITRVGDTQPIEVDFRIISATNNPLDKLVEEKKFRLDLMHRLNTFHIHIPPLRERPEDIEPLLRFFVQDIAVKLNKPIPAFENHLVELLQRYSFPGNVRELKNMVERAIILNQNGRLSGDDFPLNITALVKEDHHDIGSSSETFNLEQHEMNLIRQALLKSNNSRTGAAKLLGIDRMALVRKIQKYGIVIDADAQK